MECLENMVYSFPKISRKAGYFCQLNFLHVMALLVSLIHILIDASNWDARLESNQLKITNGSASPVETFYYLKLNCIFSKKYLWNLSKRNIEVFFLNAYSWVECWNKNKRQKMITWIEFFFFKAKHKIIIRINEHN